MAIDVSLNQPPRAPVIAGALVMLVLTGASLAQYWKNDTRVLDDRQARLALPVRLVDLNVASADELTVLPMIGPKRAEAIVQNRSEFGPFDSIEDLQRVHGIGPGITARVRPFVTVSQSESPPPGLH